MPRRRNRSGRAAMLGLPLIAMLDGPAPAGQIEPQRVDSGVIEVDMQLVLAVDVSFSISTDEQGVQRRGYVDAFRDTDVIRSVTSGFRGRIAVTMIEWAGEDTQVQIVPWTLISDPTSAEEFADALHDAPVQRSGRTSISEALHASLATLDKSPFVSFRRVVDISSDGLNNSGRRVDLARDRLLYHGVTINGLPLLTGTETGPATDLDLYFTDCVIGGLGAFMEPVTDWGNFGETLKKKLILEIAGPVGAPFTRTVPERLVRTADPVAEKMDCLTGEKEDLRQYIDQLKKATGDRAPRWIPREEDWPMPQK